MTLFAGYGAAYGTYDSADQRDGGIKLEIKRTARTVRESVTERLWQEHLEGKRSIGIIPIQGDNKCVWSCIDIDSYELDHIELVKQVERRKLPLIVCKSKSGGAHLFLFLKEPEPAGRVMAVMREVAASLGYGGSEVFPKQAEMLLDRGDLGNWLNMPYFGDTRLAVKKTGAGMSLKEFIAAAEKIAIDGQMLESLLRRKGKAPDDPDDLSDGPPCLQHLTQNGFPDHTRNKGLFALGVLARKKSPNHWKELLEGWNQKYMSPPLPADEVASVFRSLEKKDYNYTCKDTPLSTHCNAALCRTRRHGITASDQYPIISGLSVLNTDPPLWFIDIEDRRLVVDSDTLLEYHKFHKKCVEQLRIVYKPLKRETWTEMVSVAMDSVVEIEAPPEVSIFGHMRELVQDFCMNRHRGERQEDLLSGRPWHDQESNRHIFRLKDLQTFFNREGMPVTRPNLTSFIRELGGNNVFYNIKGQGTNCFWVPGEQLKATPHSSVPKLKDDKI